MVCGCCEKRIFHEKACIIRKSMLYSSSTL
uniref:Uncharacterized protein n=1 Tax=Siphoviridae sp. ct3es5 TaxID=2825322 RepID=A0A8S5PU92_9CAUD|nr:MAG TPA: hypothetical protein [Siphoviridae sp. ct3es5]